MVRCSTRGLINGYSTKGLSGPRMKSKGEGEGYLNQTSSTLPYCIVLSTDTGLYDIMNLQLACGVRYKYELMFIQPQLLQ